MMIADVYMFGLGLFGDTLEALKRHAFLSDR